MGLEMQKNGSLTYVSKIPVRCFEFPVNIRILLQKYVGIITYVIKILET